MKSKYFTEEKQEKALKWLDDKWKTENRKCEICDDEDWSFTHEIVTPSVFSEDKTTPSFVGFPHLMLTCNTCGNAKMFNAILMGVVPRSEPKNI